MRDASEAFLFSSPATATTAAPADSPFPELMPGLGHVQAESAHEQWRVPAGLLAGAVLAALTDGEALAEGKAGGDREADAAAEAWLDGALEDSFPASDPLASNRYN